MSRTSTQCIWALAILACFVVPLFVKGAEALQSPADSTPDALAFLNEVFELYAKATSYRLESVEETTMNGDFSRSWSKSLTTAIVAPGNHFRFETQGAGGSALQISDGKTEWIYSPSLQQYIQQAAPDTGPMPVKVPGLTSLNEAQRILKDLSGLQKLIRTAVYAPDESVEVNGKSVTCKVIKTEGELAGMSKRITTRFTFWIDPRVRVIRKMIEVREGPLRPEQAEIYIMERKTFFSVTDLDLVPSPDLDQSFIFRPPATASLVEKLEDPMSARVHQLVGKQAPEVSLKAGDGQELPLKSFQGRPVLLDFWATWCAPCVESLPSLEKLYRETSEKGLVLISIDQDEEPQKASEFWSKHNEPWHNFHATPDILSHFPGHGIPYFVLIDSSGRVVFSASGLDEIALRAALSKLGPAPQSKTPNP
ncbi:MAG TPA: redoxin family protein [Candidatus Acidoferrum sp.]|nr:redoxin family protein [Candidatus Acidoferrum sp.]